MAGLASLIVLPLCLLASSHNSRATLAREPLRKASVRSGKSEISQTQMWRFYVRVMHLPGFLDQQYLSFSSGAAILVNLCLVGLCKSGR